MSSFIFDQVKDMAVKGQLDFTSGTFKLALLDNTIVDSPASWSDKTLWSEIEQYEIDESAVGYNYVGYTQKTLTNVGVTTDTNDADGDGLTDYKVYADNVTWVQSTIDADCAVIYKDDGATLSLICAIDLRPNGTTVSSTVGTFTVTLSNGSGGFLIIN